MKIGIRTGFAMALMIVAVGGPASASHDGIHPTFKQERVFLQCQEPLKVQNRSYPTRWGTTPPSASYQSGAGCGFIDAGPLVNTGMGGGEGDLGMTGPQVGNLKNMTVELYVLGHTTLTALDSATDLRVGLTIDGQEFIAQNTRLTAAPVTASSSGASQKFEFTITGLGSAVQQPDGTVTTTGLATEDGDGTLEREVQLTVGLWYGDDEGIWVWGATEIPAGVTFNDPTPASKKLAVQL